MIVVSPRIAIGGGGMMPVMSDGACTNEQHSDRLLRFAPFLFVSEYQPNGNGEGREDYHLHNLLGVFGFAL